MTQLHKDKEEIIEDWWRFMAENGATSEVISESGAEDFMTTSAQGEDGYIYMSGDIVDWEEFSLADKLKIINYAGGVDGMEERLIDEGWYEVDES